MSEQEFERNFAEDIKINKYKLDKICEEHSDIHHYWYDECEKASVEVDRRKDRLELVKSETDIRLRKETATTGKFSDGVKATVDAMKSMVEIDPAVQLAKKKLITAKEDYATLKAAKGAMEHKKSQLDNLTKLWLGGYYSNPGQSRSGNDQAADKARENLNRKEG